jgi:hypothetical protein
MTGWQKHRQTDKQTDKKTDKQETATGKVKSGMPHGEQSCLLSKSLYLQTDATCCTVYTTEYIGEEMK